MSRGKGFEVAGSAAWNDLDYRTRAFTESAMMTLNDDSTIESKDGVATVAFAGDGVYGGSLGFGTSWAWNHVDRSVTASVADSNITQAAGGLAVNAVLWDLAPSDGRELLPSAYAVAATLGLGTQTTSTEVTGTVAVNQFNDGLDEHAVEASLTDSTYTTPAGENMASGLSLTSTDNSNLIAVAGGGALSRKLSIGVAAAVNVIDDSAAAYVERSQVSVNNGDVTIEAQINPELNAFALGIAVTDGHSGNVVAGSGAANRANLDADAHVLGTGGNSGSADASITVAGDVRIEAGVSYTDISVGAGAFGVDKQGGVGLGAAVAVNDLSDNQVTAFVQDASIDAGGSVTIDATSNMAPGGLILGLAVGLAEANNFALGGSVVKNTVEPYGRCPRFRKQVAAVGNRRRQRDGE